MYKEATLIELAKIYCKMAGSQLLPASAQVEKSMHSDFRQSHQHQLIALHLAVKYSQNLTRFEPQHMLDRPSRRCMCKV